MIVLKAVGNALCRAVFVWALTGCSAAMINDAGKEYGTGRVGPIVFGTAEVALAPVAFVFDVIGAPGALVFCGTLDVWDCSSRPETQQTVNNVYSGAAQGAAAAGQAYAATRGGSLPQGSAGAEPRACPAQRPIQTLAADGGWACCPRESRPDGSDCTVLFTAAQLRNR